MARAASTRELPARIHHRFQSSRTAGIRGFVLLPLAVLLLTPALSGATTTPLSGFPGYDSGRVTVQFPGQEPTVVVAADTTASLSVALSIDQVLELQPGNGTHPFVVAAATPIGGAPFSGIANGSGSGTFSLGMDGSMLVRPVAISLWNGSGGLPPSAPSAAPVSGVTSLSVAYAVTPPTATAQGLNVTWSISGWPWQSDSDRLGIELTFSVAQATGFEACTQAPTLLGVGSSGSVCGGPTLLPGGIVGNSTTVSSIAATTPGGPTAEFGWAPSAPSGAPGAALRAGAYYAGPGTAQILLSSAANGSEEVTGQGHLVIAAPPLPAVETLLRGIPGAYEAA
ncbi:MAG: hypothetical protein ACYDFT_01615, partial [Thermoplasmata archaeon]